MLFGVHRLIRTLRRTHHKKSLINISRVYELLGKIVNETKMDRALILYTTNGGGVPHVGARLYASVLYEVTNDHIKSVKDEFNRVEVDETYVDLLVQVNNQRHGVILETMSMRPGLLQSIYFREKITTSFVVRLADTPKKFYYLSVQTTAKDKTIDLATIRLAANELKRIFKYAR